MVIEVVFVVVFVFVFLFMSQGDWRVTTGLSQLL